MTQKYAPKDFYERLNNWGKWLRYWGGSMRGGSTDITMTNKICRDMAEYAGAISYAPRRSLSTMDEDDARVIEWCFARTDVRMKAVDRALLKAHFVNREDPRFICRILKLKQHKFNEHLDKSITDFYKIVQILEK